MSFLLVDSITKLRPAKFISGIKYISPQEPYLDYDENHKPCFINSLIGEALGQLAAWNVMMNCGFTKRPVAGIAKSAELLGHAYVGETIFLESFIDVLDDDAVQYHSIASVGLEPIFKIEGALGPLLPMTDFIDTIAVRKQFAQIYQAGVSLKSASTIKPIDTAPRLSFNFDHIRTHIPGLEIIAEKFIDPSSPYFTDHFPLKPVLPMTLLLEYKLQLAREFIRAIPLHTNYRISKLANIKMGNFIYPHDTIVCTLKLKKCDNDELVLACRTDVAGKRACIADIIMKKYAEELL